MKELQEKLKMYSKRLDKLTIVMAVVCSVLSAVMLYYINANEVLNIGVDDSITQIMASTIGFVMMLILAGIDFHQISRLWYIYVPAILLLVALTFTSLGYQRDGADDQAWVDLGFVSIQPSEFLKIAFVMTFSLHLAKDEEHMNHPLHMLLLILHGLVPIGIVMVQGDYGTAVVFIVMFAVMMLSAHVSWIYVVAAMLIVPAGLWVAWNYVLGDLHRNRILILFHPGTDPENLEYQQDLGLTALASGKIFGLGLHADPEKYVSVPEMHNDFIFSFVGEAFGFVGAMAVVLLLTIICLRTLTSGIRMKDRQGLFICFGFFAMFFAHCVINIGMVLKVMPVIGVPLPFLSAGGSATLSMYLALGFIMSARVHNSRQYIRYSDEER